MTRSEYKRYWNGKLHRGDISLLPPTVPTAEKAAAQVRKLKGAITVVRADQLPKDVKVLQIDGKKPGDKGYALSGK